MRVHVKQGKTAIAVAAMAVVSAAIAATLIQLDPPVVVSTSDPANNAFKAKMGWISYKSDPTVAQYDVKAQLLVYADGPAGAQNIWSPVRLTTAPHGRRQAVTNNGGNAIVTTREPARFRCHQQQAQHLCRADRRLNAGKGANALLTWTSSDCGGSVVQKINTNLSDRDPALHVPVVRALARWTAA